MSAHPHITSDLIFFSELEDIALEPGDRSTRACRAASRIRKAWAFAYVGLFDVVKGEAALLGSSGDPSGDGEDADVVVPVSSLEGDLMGTLEVRAAGRRVRVTDRLRLEACAGVLWWLWARDQVHGLLPSIGEERNGEDKRQQARADRYRTQQDVRAPR